VTGLVAKEDLGLTAQSGHSHFLDRNRAGTVAYVNLGRMKANVSPRAKLTNAMQ
jgi:hypothetical protein